MKTLNIFYNGKYLIKANGHFDEQRYFFFFLVTVTFLTHISSNTEPPKYAYINQSKHSINFSNKIQ